MCPVDLTRSLKEKMQDYVIGPAKLQGYRLGFYRRSQRRQCGVLDIVQDAQTSVQGVLYTLPWRFSKLLDQREAGYRHERVTVTCHAQQYANTRTYTVRDKLSQEMAPNDRYFQVVLRGALTCGLPEQYCWQLFQHMHQLQQSQQRSAFVQGGATIELV